MADKKQDVRQDHLLDIKYELEWLESVATHFVQTERDAVRSAIQRMKDKVQVLLGPAPKPENQEALPLEASPTPVYPAGMRKLSKEETATVTE